MWWIKTDSDRQSGPLSSLLVLLLFLAVTPASDVLAYYPYNPWARPFPVEPYRGYMPGFNRPAYVPAWPAYYSARPFLYSPWHRTFNYQRPWGSINGRVTADGNFWINIRFGGNYRDLQYLMTLMQMSANMQMQLDDTQPILPEPDMFYEDPWPM